jgi:hypothetical protein
VRERARTRARAHIAEFGSLAELRKRFEQLPILHAERTRAYSPFAESKRIFSDSTWDL